MVSHAGHSRPIGVTPLRRAELVNNGILLVTTSDAIYRWDLREGRVRRVVSLDRGRHAPARFLPNGRIVTRKKIGSRYIVRVFDDRGNQRNGYQLAAGDRLRPRPDGQPYVMKRRKLPFSPSDVLWFRDGDDYRLLGYESLSGIFTLDAAERPIKRCCQRKIGQEASLASLSPPVARP